MSNPAEAQQLDTHTAELPALTSVALWRLMLVPTWNPCLPLHHVVSSFGGISITETMSPTWKRPGTSIAACNEARRNTRDNVWATASMPIPRHPPVSNQTMRWWSCCIIQCPAAQEETILKAVGSLPKGTEVFWLNCRQEEAGMAWNTGKYSQAAELIFTTCPAYVYIGIDICLLVSFHRKKLRGSLCSSQSDQDMLFLTSKPRGEVVWLYRKDQGHDQPKWPRRPSRLCEALLVPIEDATLQQFQGNRCSGGGRGTTHLQRCAVQTMQGLLLLRTGLEHTAGSV